MLAVADLNGDGDKEILASAGNSLYIWHHDGTPFKTNPFFTCDQELSSPVVCDLNMDGKKEILVAGQKTATSKIFAVNLSGQCLAGWNGSASAASIPYTVNSLDHSISVGDINNDGKNELVAADEGQVYAWKTAGSPSAIEWGSERHDAQNTGEYAPICEAKLILTNTIWNGVTPCGNIIVQAGKFTVPSGKNLSLQKTSKIIVRSGATLEVDGGTVSWNNRNDNILR